MSQVHRFSIHRCSFVIQMLCWLSLLGVCGCAPSADTNKPSPLVIWHAYEEGGDEHRFLRESIARFENAHPGIHVRAIAVPFEPFANKIRVSVPRGNGPDLFLFAHDQLGDWASKGLLEPMGLWADSSWLGPMQPASLDAFLYKGELYGIPLVAKTLGLYYNVDLVKQPIETTEALVAEAAKLKQADQEMVGLAYDVDDLFFHAPWLLGAGGGLLEDDRFTFDQPAHLDGFVSSLELVKGWVRQGVVLPDASYDRVKDKFKRGKIAYVLSGPWFATGLKRGTYGVTTLPKIGGADGPRARPLMSVEGGYISRFSQQKPRAVSLLRFLSSKDEAEHRKTVTNQIVTRTDTRLTKDPILAAFERQLKWAVPTPNSPRMKALWTPLNRVLAEVIVRDQEPKAAIEEARRLLERGE